MANLPENEVWEDVYQWETSDRALGGPGGVMNKPLRNLVNRTAFLKKTLEDNTGAATTDKAGIVKLNDSLDSDSTASAATANAVKKVAENANGKLSKAANLSDLSDVEEALQNLGLGNGKGRLINVKTFTSSGTYTPTAGTSFVIAELLGGGGGGGSNASTPSPGYAAAAAGGASGAYAICKLPAQVYPVTVGAGGAGGIATTNGAHGSTGGTTSMGGVTCPGGYGGPYGQAINVMPTGGIVSPGSQAVTGAVIASSPGVAGSYGMLYSSSNATGGGGGNSIYGSGGTPTTIDGSVGKSPGLAASGFGAGGGGSVSVSVSTAASQKGGNGAPGIVIIWEYA